MRKTDWLAMIFSENGWVKWASFSSTVSARSRATWDDRYLIVMKRDIEKMGLMSTGAINYRDRIGESCHLSRFSQGSLREGVSK